jgi:hypothetical protein
MNFTKRFLIWFLAVSLLCSAMTAQSASSAAESTVVPRLVNFAGRATDAQAKPITGIVGLTFAIYKEQNGGTALWMETQNVQTDAKGNYAVQLGAAKPDGLPLALFSSSEARWLGVTVNGGQEQQRVLLLSVPYALKAADAETVGWSSSLGLRAVCFSELSFLCAVVIRSQLQFQPAGTGRKRQAEFPLHLDQQHYAGQLRLVSIRQRNQGSPRHWHDQTGVHPGCQRWSHDSRLVESTCQRHCHGERRLQLAT